MSAHSFYADGNQADVPASGRMANCPAAGGHLIAWGPTVPADGTEGYARGALFMCTGASGYGHYKNDGTSSSCDFNVV